MGLSWLAFSLAVVERSLSVDPAEADPGRMWICAVMACGVLLPVLAFLVHRRSVCEVAASEATKAGDRALAYRWHVSGKSYQTLSSWAVPFTLAMQLNGAATASMGSLSWYWRLVEFSILTMLISVVVLVVSYTDDTWCGPSCKPQLRHGVTESLISGSAYVVALAFLDFVVSAFGLADPMTSDEIGFLALFAGCTVIASVVELLILGYLDRLDARRAAATRIFNARNSAAVTPFQRLGRILRKLISKTSSMCAVVTVWALANALMHRGFLFGTDDESFYSALHLGSALTWLLITVITAAVVGFVVDWVLRGAAYRLAEVDRDAIPGPADDVLLAWMESILQTTIGTVMEAFAWIVGAAAHEVCLSVWALAVGDGADVDDLSVIVAAGCYAVVVSGLAVAVTMTCAPAPPEG